MKKIVIASTDHVISLKSNNIVHLPIRFKKIEIYLRGKYLGEIDKKLKKNILKNAQNVLVAEIKERLENDETTLGIVTPETFWGEEPEDKKNWHKAAKEIFIYIGKYANEVVCYSAGVPSKFLEEIPEEKIRRIV